VTVVGEDLASAPTGRPVPQGAMARSRTYGRTRFTHPELPNVRLHSRG
jgi:hypothetical protein